MPEPVKFPYTMSSKTVTIFLGNQTISTDRSNANWDAIKEALKDPTTTKERLLKLTSIEGQREIAVAKAKEALAARSDEVAKRLEIVDGEIRWNGSAVHDFMSSRLRDIWQEGLDVSSWAEFIRNIYLNPEPFAIKELFGWLEKAEMPVTPDGHFLAYKKVNKEYKDCHTNTIDNSVGRVVTMPREAVDKNRRASCSSGLHFCSKGYLKSFTGEHTMILKINPADVVSIPIHDGETKGRCWRYEVVGELNQEDALDRIWAPVAEVVAPKLKTRASRVKAKAEKVKTKQAKVEKDEAVEWGKAEKAKQTKAKQTKAFNYPEGVRKQTTKVIVRSVHGDIDATKFQELLNKHGNLANIARHFGVSQGTVQAWRKKLTRKEAK